MQKLYTTTLSCKRHEFQVGLHSKNSGILPVTGLFETSVVLEEVQLAYSRRRKKLPIDSFSKYLSNRISVQMGVRCCDCVQIGWNCLYFACACRHCKATQAIQGAPVSFNQL